MANRRGDELFTHLTKFSERALEALPNRTLGIVKLICCGKERTLTR